MKFLYKFSLSVRRKAENTELLAVLLFKKIEFPKDEGEGDRQQGEQQQSAGTGHSPATIARYQMARS